MNAKLNDWLHRGEAIYERAMTECAALEQQIAQLQALHRQRCGEVAEIADLLGKPSTRPIHHEPAVEPHAPHHPAPHAGLHSPQTVRVSSAAVANAFTSSNGKH